MVPPPERAHAYASLLRSGECAGGVSEAQISRAEVELGVSFPPGYRRFLNEHGAVLFDGCEIAGLIPPERMQPAGASPYWRDVVKSNLWRVRDLSLGRAERACIEISGDGADHVFLLDTDPAAGERVVALGPGADYKVVASDFESFVVALLTSGLEY